MNNKSIIESGFCRIRRIILTSIIVIYIDLAMNNSQYPAQSHPIVVYNLHTSLSRFSIHPGLPSLVNISSPSSAMMLLMCKNILYKLSEKVT